ncbi:hypothetical protein ACIP4U_30355 [Streptomyces caelestis]|uniref:hypothetical protein n=1 Tax=Streptomyces caelestis TaxID=36816 RepID=UPI0038301746
MNERSRPDTAQRPPSAGRWCSLEQSRAVATLYDKRGLVFLGTAMAAALASWLRS